MCVFILADDQIALVGGINFLLQIGMKVSDTQKNIGLSRTNERSRTASERY